MSGTQRFRTSGGRCSTGVVVLPWDVHRRGASERCRSLGVRRTRHGGRGPGAGHHPEASQPGNLRPGDRCLIMVATDGTPGSHTSRLHLRAAGNRGRWLIVEVPGDDDSLVVIERRSPDRRSVTGRWVTIVAMHGEGGGVDDRTMADVAEGMRSLLGVINDGRLTCAPASRHCCELSSYLARGIEKSPARPLESTRRSFEDSTSIIPPPRNRAVGLPLGPTPPP